MIPRSKIGMGDPSVHRRALPTRTNLRTTTDTNGAATAACNPSRLQYEKSPLRD
jgi:hypothetical protein